MTFSLHSLDTVTENGDPTFVGRNYSSIRSAWRVARNLNISDGLITNDESGDIVAAVEDSRLNTKDFTPGAIINDELSTIPQEPFEPEFFRN